MELPRTATRAIRELVARGEHLGSGPLPVSVVARHLGDDSLLFKLADGCVRVRGRNFQHALYEWRVDHRMTDQ